MEDKTTGEHLDPTSEISLESIKQKAVRGVAVLTGRTIILTFVSFLSQTLLWAFIAPEEYGVFLLVSQKTRPNHFYFDPGWLI